MNNDKAFSMNYSLLISLVIVLTLFISTSTKYAQTSLSLTHSSINDSINIAKKDSIQTTNSVSFGKVVAQFLGGTLFGILGMVPAMGINSPIIAGVGYLLGSSVGVYIIGNIGSTKGNFWFTLAGGTATELLFIFLADKSSDLQIKASIILGGIFAILSAEILTYHLTKPKINITENVSINFLDGSNSPLKASNEILRITNYDAVYPLVGIKINF